METLQSLSICTIPDVASSTDFVSLCFYCSEGPKGPKNQQGPKGPSMGAVRPKGP